MKKCQKTLSQGSLLQPHLLLHTPARRPPDRDPLRGMCAQDKATTQTATTERHGPPSPGGTAWAHRWYHSTPSHTLVDALRGQPRGPPPRGMALDLYTTVYLVP